MLRKWRELEETLVRRGLDSVQARDLLWTATQKGVLRVTKPASMVENQLLDGTIPDDLVVTSVRQALNHGLVATLPVSGSSKSLLRTLRVFRLIIAAASQEIVIASPYIDDAGVAELKNPLLEATRRNVKIRLLTRETDRQQSSRTRGLSELAALAGSHLTVRDYYTARSDGWFHFTSVHAKLLLADNTIGYVGSAEIRGNAFKKNFELGAIITDEEAIASKKAFEVVWAVAQPVRLL